jgi:hypothetical protein
MNLSQIRKLIRGPVLRTAVPVRGWAELVRVGGTLMRLHWPCGHDETVDLANVAGPMACSYFVTKLWAEHRGGLVLGGCKQCRRDRAASRRLRR